MLIVFLITPSTTALNCYSCTSTLDADTDSDAQVALRVFLDYTYNLPPVNSLCNDSSDVEFSTIPTSKCSAEDTENNGGVKEADRCVKIEARSQGKTTPSSTMVNFNSHCIARNCVRDPRVPVATLQVLYECQTRRRVRLQQEPVCVRVPTGLVQ